MSNSIFLRLITFVILGANLLAVGCGKKAEERQLPKENVTIPISTINEFLSKQNISCEKGLVCPSYIAKVVAVNGSDYRFCTAFLVSPNVMATTTSCLPNILRRSGQDCSRDIHFFFPNFGNTPPLQAGCSKVIQVSDIEGSDPILWRDDLTFLELKEPIYNRRKAIFSRLGPSPGKALATWVADQQDSYSAILKKFNCEPIYNSYINPLSSSETSPNLIFGDCLLPKSAIGSPIIDGSGRVKAIASRMTDNKVFNHLTKSGLLLNGLKKIFHATNFACANILDDTDMSDERECLKDLSESKVIDLRSEMLSSSRLFNEQQKKFLSSLKLISKNLNFSATFSSGDLQEAQIFPSCFKPYKEWLGRYGNDKWRTETLDIPSVYFRKVVDSNGHAQGIMFDKGSNQFKFQYSLKNLRTDKYTSVLKYSETTESERFPDISEKCTL